MPGSWSDFLKLRSGPAPPPSAEAGAVRVYADSGGTLRSVQSDGTDAAIGGGGGSTPELHGALAYLGNAGQRATPYVFWELVAYDTDSFWVPDPDNAELQIPTGLSGIYLVEAAVYIDTASGNNPDLDRPTAVIIEPSDSCDIQMDRKNPDSNAPFDPGWWYGSGSFVRPFVEGDTVSLRIAGSTSDPSGRLWVNGGTSQTMMTVTKLYDLPDGYVSPF